MKATQTEHKQQLPQLLARLAAAGRRVTGQRAAVCAALLQHGGHPTPTEVRDLVWRAQPAISQATVYNTLAMLEEIGLLRRLEIAGHEHTHYDVDVDPHVNLVCTGCGRISDVHTDTLEALLGLLAARSGYDIDGAGLVVLGRCPDCHSRRSVI